MPAPVIAPAQPARGSRAAASHAATTAAAPRVRAWALTVGGISAPPAGTPRTGKEMR